jgi:arginine-tRNA-protein transferase
MHIIQPPQIEELSFCPYLKDRQKQYEYFFADQLSAKELSGFLALGWRKFGIHYFRPACPGCRNCIPLRIPIADFVPSRGQRRILRKNAGLRVVFGPLRFSDRIFAIYQEHSRRRFSQESNLEDFLYSFFLPSCPSLQSEIYLGDKLIAVGFLDRGEDCLSSVYFCFDTRHTSLNLGTYSILQEIFYARSLGLPYYYLGYYVPGCRSMAYKDHFRLREYFDWQTCVWKTISGPPESLLDAC